MEKFSYKKFIKRVINKIDQFNKKMMNGTLNKKSQKYEAEVGQKTVWGATTTNIQTIRENKHGHVQQAGTSTYF